MRGRPTKFRPEVGQRIVDLIRITGMMEAAAAASGIHRATLYRWLDRGSKQRTGELRDFHDAVIKSQGESEIRLLTLITKAATSGDWRAATWLLEKRNPQVYGARMQVTLKQALEEMVDHVATNAPHLTEDILRLFADEGAPSVSGAEGVVILPMEERYERASLEAKTVPEGDPDV